MRVAPSCRFTSESAVSMLVQVITVFGWNARVAHKVRYIFPMFCSDVNVIKGISWRAVKEIRFKTAASGYSFFVVGDSSERFCKSCFAIRLCRGYKKHVKCVNKEKNRLDCESSQKGKSLWKRKYISKGCLLLIDITIQKKCDKCVMNFLTIYGKYLKEMWKINFNRLL